MRDEFTMKNSLSDKTGRLEGVPLLAAPVVTATLIGPAGRTSRYPA